MKWEQSLLVVLSATMCIVVGDISMAQDERDPQTISPEISLQYILDKAKQESFVGSFAILMMESSDSLTESLGSGFFVRDNTIATCLHVIEGMDRGRIILKRDKSDISGVVGVEHRLDIALLCVTDVNVIPIELDNSEESPIGEEIYLWGYRGFKKGSVDRVLELDSVKFLLIEVKEPVDLGYSGGPIISFSRGKVIGMVVGNHESHNMVLALPAHYISQFLYDTELHSAAVTPLSKQEGTRQRFVQKREYLEQTHGIMGVIYFTLKFICSLVSVVGISILFWYVKYADARPYYRPPALWTPIGRFVCQIIIAAGLVATIILVIVDHVFSYFSIVVIIVIAVVRTMGNRQITAKMRDTENKIHDKKKLWM